MAIILLLSEVISPFYSCCTKEGLVYKEEEEIALGIISNNTN